MAFYLGIDGGGSKTTCAIGDANSTLATATAGPSNITRVEQACARESLHQAIREACAYAKIDPGQIDCACIGAAGAGRQEVAEAVRAMVAEMIGGAIEVVGDMAIALTAAFGAGPGVIVIAGTGSIAYGRNQQGTTARAGGWGFNISDEGSAHWIGRTAVAAVLRGMDETLNQQCDDAEASSVLFRELKAVWNARSLEEFVRTANSSPDFAVLLPTIISTAEAGNTLSCRVLEQAGSELSHLARITIRHLFTEAERNLNVVPLAMIGGVFRHSATVRQSFGNELCKLEVNVHLNPHIVEPVEGALQMARRARFRKP